MKTESRTRGTSIAHFFTGNGLRESVQSKYSNWAGAVVPTETATRNNTPWGVDRAKPRDWLGRDDELGRDE